MDRVDVNPELLRWARERAGLGVDTLAGRFPRLGAWERGEIRPTLKDWYREFVRSTGEDPRRKTSSFLDVACEHFPAGREATSIWPSVRASASVSLARL